MTGTVPLHERSGLREASKLALDVFVHRVAGAVAALASACGGLDAPAFTGGNGASSVSELPDAPTALTGASVQRKGGGRC